MTAAIRAEKIIGQYANILGTIAQRANGIGLSLAADDLAHFACAARLRLCRITKVRRSNHFH